MRGIVGDFLLLLRSRRALDLLDVGRLMGRLLGVGGMGRGIVGLGRGLGRRRLVRRLGMVLLVVMLRVVRMLDGAGPRVVLGMLGVMGRRRQALGGVGVMHPLRRYRRRLFLILPGPIWGMRLRHCYCWWAWVGVEEPAAQVRARRRGGAGSRDGAVA